MIVADQAAGVRCAIVRNWTRAVCGHHIQIEINQTLPETAAGLDPSPVGCVTH